MRKLPFLVLALLVLSSFMNREDNVEPVVRNIVSVHGTDQNVLPPISRIATMKTKEVEKLIGRKLSLKEKISLKIVQYKIKKGLKAKEEGKSSKGQTAMILGIIGLACIIIPYGILASIPLAILAIVMGAQARKENKNDGKAQTGIILGIVTLGLIVLAILVVVLLLATWGWGW